MPGGGIVQIGLADGLPVPLADQDRIPGVQKKLTVGLYDVVHVDQIALVAAEKALVAQLLLDFVQPLVYGIGQIGGPVEQALGVAALHIENLVQGDADHVGPLADGIGAGLKGLKDAVHDAAELFQAEGLEQIAGGLHVIAVHRKVGGGGEEDNPPVKPQRPQLAGGVNAQMSAHVDIQKYDVKSQPVLYVLNQDVSALIGEQLRAEG